jgi:hypothetical protein
MIHEMVVSVSRKPGHPTSGCTKPVQTFLNVVVLLLVVRPGKDIPIVTQVIETTSIQSFIKQISGAIMNIPTPKLFIRVTN